jgi:hypothetical protein
MLLYAYVSLNPEFLNDLAINILLSSCCSISIDVDEVVPTPTAANGI